ncbi:MAG: hypothetical protein E4H32_07295 [Nitrospirales bacterium]|nr:MAG: hypothetical protein E4H32_07295 [Nitrospirales bacterium]
MKDHPIVTLSLNILLIALLASFNDSSSPAQHTGEQAEMGRLEQQADDLAAQSDPEGAALAIGRAAMMADLLTKKAQEPATQDSFQAASLLYRAQELGLRALALFDRTGGIPPAPAGICQYLSQANKKLAGSKTLLENTLASSQEDITTRRNHLLKKIKEWQNHLQGLHEDFACSVNPNE